MMTSIMHYIYIEQQRYADDVVLLHYNSLFEVVAQEI